MKRNAVKTSRIRYIKDRLFFGFICLFTFLSAIPLFMILGELVVKGYKQINIAFLQNLIPVRWMRC